MTPDRWRQIEALYQTAQNCGAAERTALLHQADPEIRAVVERMLDQEGGNQLLDMSLAALLHDGSNDASNDASKTFPGPGAQLGPYRVQAQIGAGGMGTVYRAIDTRLDRVVAIKIAAQRYSERFQIEARVISTLNHPHICTLYDVGPDYLVMECIEGSALADEIAKRPIAPELLVRYGSQIASALAEAHAHGIVHRDLKPGNVMVTRHGVKVLDFGLAKMFSHAGITETNAIMGTPAYMAPEQMQGRECDARTDIYALGLVLAEMATGKRTIPGGRPQLDSLPEKVGHVIERCLAESPEDRWQNARDVKAELEWAAEDAPGQRRVQSRGRIGRWWQIPTAVAMLALVALAMVYFRKPVADIPVISATILPPEKASFDPTASASLSPDGTRIVFSATGEDGKSQLWFRQLDGTEAQPLPGTSGGTFPFWSPDGRSVGFFARGKLKKTEVSGGLPVDLCDASLGSGGSWATDGQIVFAPEGASPLFRVPASGGQRVQVTSLNATREEDGHNFPQFLPDNRHFLYHSSSASAASSGIYLGSLDGGEPKLLLRGISNALFAPPGHILFLQNGALMARRFDPHRNELSGDSVMIARLPDTADVIGASLSASGNGILTYIARASAGRQQLEWFNRDGTKAETVGEPGIYYTPRLSPDGGKIAVAVAPPGSPTRDLWIFNQAYHSETRLTFDHLHNWTPVWSPDATQLAYSSNPTERFHIYVRAPDGSGARQPLLEDDAVEYVDSWSSDGQYVAYAREAPGGKPGWDIWVLPLFGSKNPFPLTRSPSNKEDPSISPDQKWLAYDSDESGQWEVYVIPFPHGEGKWQASKGGGRQPRWRGDSRELFFLGTGNKLTAAEVRDKGASLEIGDAQSLPIQSAASPFRTYDVTGDGKKFIVVSGRAELNAKGITVIAHWPLLIGKK